MRRPIINNSSPGQAVYDPFLGSGTTLIAAETVGRVCFGIEIDPLFVDVAVRRWQAFTGKEATFVETGESFAALEESRADQEYAAASSSRPAPSPGSKGRRQRTTAELTSSQGSKP